MKMKFRGMTLAAMLLSASTVASGEENEVTYDGDGFVTPVAFVGDVASEEDAYFAEDASYAMRAETAARSNNSGAVRSASHSVQQAPQFAPARQPARQPVQQPVRQQYAPIGAAQLQPVGFNSGYSSAGYCDAGCSVGCDSGCDSMGGSSCFSGMGGLTDMLGCSGSPGWARAEFLMWFVQPVETPPLVTVAPQGQFPDLTNPNTQVAFGGELDSDLSVGFRGDYGKWVTDDIGIGGRFWIIDESSDSYYRQSNGSDVSIGRPFFNTGLNQNDALIVALDGQFAGSVSAESSIDLLAAEAYARINFVSGSCCRTDLIGGYSYFQIDHLLTANSTTVNNGTGQIRTFSDLGETENRFQGGQIGFRHNGEERSLVGFVFDQGSLGQHGTNANRAGQSY